MGLNDHLGYAGVGGRRSDEATEARSDEAGADRAGCLAAIVHLSKSSRAVMRGIDVFYIF